MMIHDDDIHNENMLIQHTTACDNLHKCQLGSLIIQFELDQLRGDGEVEGVLAVFSVLKIIINNDHQSPYMV